VTLLVDWNATAADQLAAQLGHAGFPAEVAYSAELALLAVERRHFRSVVVVADLARVECIACLRAVSHASPRSWLVVIGSRDDAAARELVLQSGADVLMTAPFAVDGLASRLASLASHERSG
jgi:DNA-binding response OmpR family regulator